MDVGQQFILNVGAALAAAAIVGGIGWRLGLHAAERRRRRLILRNKGSTPLADMVVETGKDGAMEFKVSNAALKRMRRGESVEGLIQGSKNAMRVRLSSL